MRILLTGMTRMQVNGNRRRDYNTSINALYNALRQARHDVEWRPLEYNEPDLQKKFDVIILGLGTISEYSCQYLYQTLLASQYDNVLYLVNDWKANKTLKMLVTGDLFRDFVMGNNTGNRLEKMQIMKDQKLLEKCRNEMFRRNDNLLGPFFEWGDRSIITSGTPFESIHEFNPTAFYLAHWNKVQIPKTKKKQWVYGALDTYTRWHERLKAKWPIRAFNKKTFIPEQELVQLYAKSHGMLLPKYSASGSGWWRARYCHGLVCQNVMYAEKKEWGVFAEYVHMPVDAIERMSVKKLHEFAQHQHDEIMRRTPSWKRVVDDVNNIVHEVATW